MNTDVVLRRIGAVLIDGILLFVASAIILLLLELIGINVWETESSEFSFSATTTFGGTFISMLLSLGYKVWMEATKGGQTVGKMALGIRVVKEHSGAPITLEGALIRGAFWQAPFTLSGLGGDFWLLGLIGMIWLIAGLISLIVSPTRQRLGDRVAHTIVVRDHPVLQQFVSQPSQAPVRMATGVPMTGAPTSVQGETWLTCGYCDSRFPQSRAHQGIWEGRNVALCPNCGAPLDENPAAAT